MCQGCTFTSPYLIKSSFIAVFIANEILNILGITLLYEEIQERKRTGIILYIIITVFISCLLLGLTILSLSGKVKRKSWVIGFTLFMWNILEIIRYVASTTEPLKYKYEMKLIANSTSALVLLYQYLLFLTLKDLESRPRGKIFNGIPCQEPTTPKI